MAEFSITNTSPFTVADNTASVTATLTLRNTDGRVVGPVSVTRTNVGSSLPVDGSLGELKTLIESTPPDGILDLQGKVYALTEDEDFDGSISWNGIQLRESITIRNGTIIWFRERIPTNEGNNIFTVPNDTDELLIQIYDPAAENKILRLAKYPPQNFDTNTSYLVDENSFNLNTKNLDEAKGELIFGTVDGIVKLIGFKITDSELTTDVIEILDEIVSSEGYADRAAAAQGMGIINEVLPNALHITTISTYTENSDNTIDIIWEIPKTIGGAQSGEYVNKFNFFGRKTFFNYGPTDIGAFSFDDNKIYYRPSSGVCNQLFVPKTFDRVNSNISHCFKSLNGLTHRFEDLTIIGSGRLIKNGSYDGNLFFFEGDKELYLRNVTTYFGYRIAICNNLIDAENCSFNRPFERGLVGEGNTTIKVNRCEFKDGFYQVEPITRSNSLNLPDNELKPLTITNCYFRFISNHGSGFSAYAGSWINTKVVGNIFYNIARVASYQWSRNFDIWRVQDLSSYDGFVFNNNLIYVDQPTGEFSGQSTLSYNGSPPYTVGIGTQNSLSNLSSNDRIRFIDNDENLIFPEERYLRHTAQKTDDAGNNYLLTEIFGYEAGNTGARNETLIELETNPPPKMRIYRVIGGAEEVIHPSVDITEVRVPLNVPPFVFKNNTVMFSKGMIERTDGFGYTPYFKNAVVAFENAINCNGPIVMENNCISTISNRLLLAPARQPSTDNNWAPSQGVIRRLWGETTSQNNIIWNYFPFHEKPFPSIGNDINVLNDIGDARENYEQTLPDEQYIQMWDLVYDPSQPKTNPTYSSQGIQWSAYPNYEDIKNLDYTWSDTYTPSEIPI